MQIVSLALTIAFTLLAALHFLWASGFKMNTRAFIPSVDGKPLFEPGPVGTVAVALVLMGFAFIALALGFPDHMPARFLPFIKTLGILIGLVLLVRAVGDFRYAGFFKRITGNPFATYDTWLYSPFCLISGLGYLFLAILR